MPTLTSTQEARVQRALLALGNIQRAPHQALGISDSRMESIRGFASSGHGWNNNIRNWMGQIFGNAELWSRMTAPQRRSAANLIVEVVSGDNEALVQELRELGLAHLIDAAGQPVANGTDASLAPDDGDLADEDEDYDDEDG